MEDKEDGKIETLPLPRQLVRQIVDSGKVLGNITHLQQIELNSVRPYFYHAMNQIQQLKHPDFVLSLKNI